MLIRVFVPVSSVGYSRGGYNQNRWGSSYRDSGGRGGYNRNQQPGGSYNHNRQGSYNKGSPGGGGGGGSSYSQSQVPEQSMLIRWSSFSWFIL